MEIKRRLYYSPPMHKFLRNRHIEKAALWGVLGVLNAPLAFFPALVSFLMRLNERTRSHDSEAKIAALESRAHILPQEDRLTRLVKDMGAQAGINVQNVFANPRHAFRNAMILCERRSEVSIIFEGHPLRDAALNQTAQGEAVARGIIAHEIGHALSSGDNSFQSNAVITGMLYTLGSGISMVAGVMSLLGGGLVMGAGMLAGMVAGLGAGFATMALNQRFSRNEEYLADLRGAALFGADDMVICHEYNLKVLQRGKNSPPPPKTFRESLVTACLDFYGEEHPAPADRIAALRAVFNTAARYDVPQTPPAPLPIAPPQSSTQGPPCTRF